MTPGDALTLVPRVKSFTNKYVTKAYDSSIGEDKIKHLAYIIFDSAGNCVDMAESDVSSTTSLTINKTKLNSSETSATVVLFANVKFEDIKKENTDENGKPNGTFTALSNQTTLSELDEYSINFKTDPVVLSSELSSFNGFPMKGVATGVNLTTASNADIEVALQILYAKISFDIDVAEGTENQNLTENGPSFSLSSYSVHNVSQRTPVTIAEGEATPSTAYAYKATGKSGSGTNNEFTFYMAESRYTPKSTEGGKIDLTGIYPNGWTTQVAAEDVKGYTEGMENQLNGVKYFYDDLIQQYKPILTAGTQGTPSNTSPAEGENAEGLAAYVLVNGTYVDYRGTSWDVNYKVYLGKDNAHDFHVDRNSEYTNILTIKGIRNNDDHTGTDVWIDHRVDVSTTGLSGNVTITRETLIDSHIEVRPLRVQWSGDTYAGVRVYLPTDKDGLLLDWIGMERFTGENCLDGSTYCYVSGQAIGKRKYFTTSLISELQSKTGEFGVQNDNGRKYIYLLNGECAWIYFDEHTGSSDREATIKLTFYSNDGNSTSNEEYLVKQHHLETFDDYAVESYEEYLHSYDSADKYNLTTSPYDYTQQGFKWGLNDIELSENSIVCPFELNTLSIPLVGEVEPKNYIPEERRYDYFLSTDGQYYLYTKEGETWTEPSFGTGLDFTKKAGEKALIKVKDMGSVPENAYQYCLSKNKFEVKADGTVEMKIKWYLPDCHELQSVLNTVDASTKDFILDGFYWSSQPSSIDFGLSDLPVVGSYLTGYSIKDEDQSKARAASKTQISDVDRTDFNRIRCFYDSDGRETNMTGRVPDGVGGNFTFYMHAYISSQKSAHGFFQYLLPAAVTKPTSTTHYRNDEFGYNATTDEYPYPTSANSSASTEFKYRQYTASDGSTIGGFDKDKDPGSKNNWDETLADYFSTLNTYPGLSRYVTEKGVSSARKETSTEKKDVVTTTDVSTINLNKPLISSTSLNFLDHVNGGEMFNISFNTVTNGNNTTFIYDERVSESKTEVTRYWEPPVYTLQTYTLQPDDDEVSESATESKINTNVVKDKNQARQNAFDRAYSEAKESALKKLNSSLNTKNQSDPGWVISGDVQYTELAWNTIPESSYSNETRTPIIFGAGGYWSSTCQVTVTATATIVKSASVQLYNISTDAYWRNGGSKTTTSNGVIDNDKLQFYVGNSFTVSLSDETFSEGGNSYRYSDVYEITKVTIYTSDNFIDDGRSGTINEDEYEVYARFVDSEISLPKGDSFPIYGSSEVYQLEGMEYSVEQNTGLIIHQWTGNGRSGVTLGLEEYRVTKDFGITGGLKYDNVYKYDKASSSYYGSSIVIDRIEVKCTKKATAASE